MSLLNKSNTALVFKYLFIPHLLKKREKAPRGKEIRKEANEENQ